VRQLVTVPVPKAALALFNRLAKDKLPHALINHEEFEQNPYESLRASITA